MRSARVVVVGVGVGLAVLLWGLAGGTATAPTPVANCTTIDAPGSYQLAGDVSNATADPCLEITADDVVVAGAGHTIDGAGSGNGTGIRAAGSTTLSNVTVRNVAVTGFQHGIDYQRVTGGTIERVTASNNTGIGALFQQTDATDVTDSTVADNARDGVRLVSSPGNTIVGVRSADNGNIGVHLTAGSSNTTVTSSTVAGNRVGISISTASNDTLVEHSVVENSAGDGVSLESADATHLRNVTAANNGRWALHQVGAGTTTSDDLVLSSATVDTTSSAVALGPVDSPTAPPSGKAAVGGRVNATDTGAGAFLFLNVSYSGTAGVDESSLRVWRHDGAWNQVPGTNGVDTVDDHVYANVTSFPGAPAEYAPLGDASTATLTPTATATPTPAPTATPTTATPTATPTPSQTTAVQTTAVPSTPQPTPVPVDDCVDIDQPGYYVLEQDLTDRPEGICIDVLVGGVIVDGDGHTIDSDGSSSTAAIRAGDFSGSTTSSVTVRNVDVSDWSTGVWFHAVDGGAIREVTSTNQTVGVAVHDSASVAVADVTGTQSGGPNPGGGWWWGSTVELVRTDDSTVERVVSEPTTLAETGVMLDHVTNVSVADVAFDSDAGSGVTVTNGTDVALRDVRIDAGSNTWHGANIVDSHAVELRDATIEDVGLYSVTVGDTSDAVVVNVTTRNSGQLALFGESGATNLTVREFHLGAASTPTTVDARGDRFNLAAVPAPPADPGGERNLSRYVEVGGPSPSVLVNVSYTLGDVSTADVDDTTIDPWIHDGSWSQASGTAGTDTGAFRVYVEVSSSGNPTGIVAPLGEAGSGASVSQDGGFGLLAAVVAVAACLGIAWRRR